MMGSTGEFYSEGQAMVKKYQDFIGKQKSIDLSLGVFLSDR